MHPKVNFTTELQKCKYFSERRAAAGELKIADFGWLVHTFAGEPCVAHWIIFHLRCVCLCDMDHFQNTSCYSLHRKRIIQVDLKFPSKPIVSSSAKDLISQMLVKSSSQRLPLHKLLEHPWIVQNAEPSGVYRG
ncbi:hypothetical protein GLYMA_06G088700v4 [Glycine max]|nr:hypothetical protein GLYMA_06G088700v4 [Glycine max]KAH1124902.1 hypothetical protein GYH30_014511 [Glycine max]